MSVAIDDDRLLLSRNEAFDTLAFDFSCSPLRVLSPSVDSSPEDAPLLATSIFSEKCPSSLFKSSSLRRGFTKFPSSEFKSFEFSAVESCDEADGPCKA